MGTQLPLARKGAQPPIFGPCLLWPNGWMDQLDATSNEGRPRPGQQCVKYGPSSTPNRTAPNFGPCLLWPNGWMDQDATWYDDEPQPRPHTGTQLSLPEGAQPPIFGLCLLCQNGRPSQLLLSTCCVMSTSRIVSYTPCCITPK